MPVVIHGIVSNPPITDATATVDDVLKDKIFYNNDGRQVGTASIPKVMCIDIPVGTVGRTKFIYEGYKGREYKDSSMSSYSDFDSAGQPSDLVSRTVSGPIMYCTVQNVIFTSTVYYYDINALRIWDGGLFFFSYHNNTIYYKNEGRASIHVDVFYK